jgi:TonB family protein
MAVSQSFTGPTETEPELHLLPAREAITPRRLAPAAVGSILFHITIMIMWATIPDAPFAHYGQRIPDLNRSVKLYIPRDFELTQKDPNQGKISHELDIRSMRQAAQPSSPRVRTPSPPPGPVIPTPQPIPQTTPQPKPVQTVIQAAIPAEPPKPDAPKIELPAAIPAVTAVAPKQTPQQEKPKLAFEDVGGAPPRTTPDPSRNIPLPKEMAPDPSKRPATPSGGGGAIVGDIGQSSLTNPNALHAPSQGESKSNLQLLSDPKGVDFKPYMIQVLAAVRRNWLAIIPDSARMGRRGRVIIQFAIDRSGSVPKVVIAEPTGTAELDRAAVAAISAANPLPPLPPEFKGDQIRLQLAFSYNMPAR